MSAGTLFDLHDPFDLVDGVPRDLIANGVEPRDEDASYLRLHDGLLEDEAVGDLIADCGVAGLGVLVALLIATKDARAYGVLTCNAMTFGGSIGATPADVLEAVRSMDRAGLVWARIDGRRVTLRFRRWFRYQSMTDAERKRLDRRRAKSSAKTGRRPSNADDVRNTRTTSAHGDGDGNGNELPPGPASSAPAHVREPAREASGDWAPVWEPLAVALRRMYDDEPAVAAAVGALRYECGMRKAVLTIDGMTYAVGEIADRMERDPGWSPAELVPLAITIAKSHRPDAAPVRKPTPKERPDDRPEPTIAHDPALARFN